jgi:transposase
MSREIKADYQQRLMFPPSLEDWVGSDHPARFIRDFVDSLDLPSLGFQVRPGQVGRPHYSVELLLKVWLYGYLNKIRSTRQLERSCRENLGLVWLTGMNAPDHNTLWRFWQDNREGLRQVFKQSVRVALHAGLVGLALHAVDGTKIMTASSRRGVWHREDLEKLLIHLDESLTEVMLQVESATGREQGEYRLPEELQDQLTRRQRIQEALKFLADAGQDHLHPAEPEARFMKLGPVIELSYNAQVVADEDSRLVVAAEVVNAEADVHQLVPMLDQVKENLGVTAQENLADGGYAASSQVALAEEKGYEVLIPAGKREPLSTEDRPYHTSRFRYDESRDCCICPRGQVLTYERTKAGRRKTYMVRIYRCRGFRDCPVHRQCSRNPRGRQVEIGPHHQAMERQRQKRREKKTLLPLRKTIVEPVMAWVKWHLDFRRWTVRGLENVRTQWALLCTTINLKKLFKHWVAGRLVLEIN